MLLLFGLLRQKKDKVSQTSNNHETKETVQAQNTNVFSEIVNKIKRINRMAKNIFYCCYFSI